MDATTEGSGVRPTSFPTTSWREVLAVDGESADSAQALAGLCSTYWQPVYAYVRCRGYAIEDARDLTQEFFTRLLEHHLVRHARQDRGSFRSFLLASVRNFLANEWDRATALKRGGGRQCLSLDFDAAENRYSLEPADRLTPDKVFERRWALALLDRVLARLRVESQSKGRAAQFEKLKQTLTGDESCAYRQMAGELGLSEGAVKVAAHRLRLRYRELIRAEIAQTVAEPGDVEQELAYLFCALGSP